MSSSVRAVVRTLLQPLITGNRWSVQPHTVKQIGTLSRTTVFIEHTNIEQLPTAPIGQVQNTVVVTILSHLTDYVMAEDAIDPAVLELIVKLEEHQQLNWVRAEKITVKDMYLGWAITLTLITDKEA